jgi:D-alanyl-D-alanine carboxypeptidase/D-alanyl-D-alanine-endopeptidase (penicillin-binding protein 4)
VDDPADWSGRNLLAFLQERGISVSGKVKAGQLPEGAKLLAKADSKPLSQQVADMLKFSNNYVAEMLTKNLAAQASGLTSVSGLSRAAGAPATLEEGMKIIRAHLSGAVGIEAKRFVLMNPSGLSRHNRMRASDLAEILVYAQKNFPTFAELLSAMPLAGMDGTLKKRMLGTGTEGWIRGKTGSMSGIVSLAGYAGRKDGTMKAFAFIYNGKAESGDTVRHLFDALAEELVE